jgi:hypothetical protein
MSITQNLLHVVSKSIQPKEPHFKLVVGPVYRRRVAVQRITVNTAHISRVRCHNICRNVFNKVSQHPFKYLLCESTHA